MYKRLIISSLMLALMVGTTFAQEAEAVADEPAPAGIALLFLLIGLACVAAVGFLAWARENETE